MAISIKRIVACGCLGAAILATSACGPRQTAPLTVADLMEDRVMLDGVLMKCNQDFSRSHADPDCLNARIAIERLASQSEPAEEAKREEEFEHRREQLRMTQERQRQQEEAKEKVDAYHLPVMPVDPAPPAAPRSNGGSPPIVRETSP
jgi:hypothetical protein